MKGRQRRPWREGCGECRRGRYGYGSSDSQLDCTAGLTIDDLGFELLGELLDPGPRELHAAIQVLHQRLGVPGEDVRLAAAGPGLHSLAEAIEVQVLALGERERQTPSTLRAVQERRRAARSARGVVDRFYSVCRKQTNPVTEDGAS